jgi:hypothetical protein
MPLCQCRCGTARKLLFQHQAITPERNAPRSYLATKTHLLRLSPPVESGTFDIRSAIPLPTKVFDNAQDADTRGRGRRSHHYYQADLLPIRYHVLIELQFRSIGSPANTSEQRRYSDGALKDELVLSLYVDIACFFDAFFGKVAGLQSVNEV